MELQNLVEANIPKMIKFMDSMSHLDNDLSFFNDSVNNVAPHKTKIEESIRELNCLLESNKRPYRVHKVAGGWRFETLPEYAFLVQRLYAQREEKGLSPASMETLSVIAYRQPLMRAEIEAIRGVGCGEVLRSLLDKRLVKISGRAEAPGRPMLYGTGPEFLHLFGLSSLEDLPEVAGLSIKK